MTAHDSIVFRLKTHYLLKNSHIGHFSSIYSNLWQGAIMCTSYYKKEKHMSSTMTIRLDDSVKNRLEDLAIATNRTKSFLASEAIQKYIEINEWQIQEIQAAIEEADRGEFASDEEVNNIFNKWAKNGG
jgi:predicted transcriptional regulator